MHRVILAVAGAAMFAAPSFAQDTTRQQPPGPGPLRPFRIPAIQETRLPSGLRVVVAERHTLPIVHARIIVNAGAVHEPAPKSGLAVMTGGLLIEGGAGDMSSAELAAAIEALGAQMSASASYSLASVVLTSLSSVFPQALNLAATAVREPRFDEREFGRVRNQAMAGYEQVMSRAEGVADRLFSRAIYEDAAPYSRSPSGTAATLAGLTRDDVVSWHRTMYAPANTTILIVGDIGFDAALSLVTSTFGDWAATSPGITLPANPARQIPRTRVILVDRPGSVQSAVIAGVPGIATPDPDFFRMTVLNRVLGGGVTARTNVNLRERHGYTYGAFTTLSALQNAGTFYASSSVRTSATDSALVELVREFRTIASEIVPEDELQGSVNNLVASFPASVQSVQDLAQRLQTILIYDMPVDYYETYRERLAAVSAADLAAIARTRLNPDALTIVVVGDLATIEAPIRARNFGEVEVWDREGNRVR
ncbi:MAG TPA: pitrilysin family protein [Gemmatimonadaceae bacterium]|nr:pitrilysin family protein [Gemmatimonadaceae bacterium]